VSKGPPQVTIASFGGPALTHSAGGKEVLSDVSGGALTVHEEVWPSESMILTVSPTLKFFKS
jgi:hypothetical protein